MENIKKGKLAASLSVIVCHLSFFYLVDDGFESFGVVHGQVGEDLPVQGDPFFVELAYELRIGHVILTYAGIDTLYPECPERAFLVAPVAVSVSEPFLQGVLGYGVDILAASPVAFGLAEDLFAPSV
jgi:hypothetical protein